MIAGATRGAGGAALGHHLALADMNEHVITGESRGLVSEGIEDQVQELTRLGSHARTGTPLLHMHADPPAGRPWTGEERARYWQLMEAEFGLYGRPFASVIHVKDDREHEHRVWLRVRTDGTAIRMDHDHARREKVSRIMEWERGEPFTKGAHNRAVIAALRMERPEVAAAMEAAGLHEGPRPRAAVTPAERLQQDRTGISKKEVAACVARAWAASDGGLAFAAALAEQGLRLAQGDKCAVIVDSTGNAHSLQRMLAMAARANGTDAPRAETVAASLDGMVLPDVSEAQHAIVAQPPLPPDDSPPSPNTPTPPECGQAVPSSMDAPIHAPAPASYGGGASFPAAQATLYTMLEDAGPGPGEPPGANAHPDEIARYANALHAHAERKHAALQSFMRSMAAASDARHQAAAAGGGHHGTTQQATTRSWRQWWPAAVGAAISNGYTAEEARHAVRAAGLDARDTARTTHGIGAEQGHDRPGGGQGQGYPAGGEGCEREQRPGRDTAAADDGARPGGERGLGGGEGAADGHRGAADSPGGPPGQDRVQAHRATRSLATLNLSDMRDRLNPGRVAVREAERILASSGMPEHTAEALDRLLERVDARDPATLADLRQDGFHEVLRIERLRVIMDADQAARTDLDARPRATERWTPPIR